MANKDPAFLFYASDFLTGTMFMSNEQVGKYIRLLCSQHQHGGLIDKTSFNALVGEDSILRSKFIECDGGFYNIRLADEMTNRSKKSTNISDAAKETWRKRKESNTIVLQPHKDSNTIPIRTEDENENAIRNIDKYSEDFKNDYRIDEKVCMENGFTPEHLSKARLEFWNSKELDSEMAGKPYQDVQKHFLNWCRKNKERLKKVELSSPTKKYKPI